MRKRYVAYFALVAVAFSVGYFVASRQTESYVAEHELAALMHYNAAIAYLQKEQIENAKTMLYIGADSTLSVLSENNAASLNQSSHKILKEALTHLNKSWEKDQPFVGEQWASLKATPEWVDMRNKHDEFRRNYSFEQ